MQAFIKLAKSLNVTDKNLTAAFTSPKLLNISLNVLKLHGES